MRGSIVLTSERISYFIYFEIIFNCVDERVSLCGYVQVNAVACGGQRLSMPLELEL